MNRGEQGMRFSFERQRKLQARSALVLAAGLQQSRTGTSSGKDWCLGFKCFLFLVITD